VAKKIWFTEYEYNPSVVKVWISQYEHNPGVVKVFPVSNEYNADIKGFMTEYEGNAQMKIFIVDSEYA
jgi:hypothetical protein